MSEHTAAQGEDSDQGAEKVRRAGRVLAPVLAIAVYVGLAGSSDLSDAGRTAAAVATLMAVLWIAEALPLAVTALLPLLLFPLAGVMPLGEVSARYADPFIFLFLGGFMIALSIERWGLHRRFALWMVLLVGTRPGRMVGGAMLATALLSMWLSNTATTLMMLPIGLGVVTLFTDRRTTKSSPDTSPENSPDALPQAGEHFATCMLLGIAYAANIGGFSTLIGTPPNVFMAAYLNNEFSIRIGFGEWMVLGVPLAAAMLAMTWIVLTRVLYPLPSSGSEEGRKLISRQLAELGPISRGEWTVLGVFGATAFLWIFRQPLADWPWLAERLPAVGRLDDPTVAIAGALALFIIPVDSRRGVFALDWPTAARLPWGLLLLFGGGLALADAVSSTGLDQWIGGLVERLSGLPAWALVLTVVALVIFLTELTSNIATASAVLPILGAAAAGLDVNPILLVVPAALAASCAFMLPVGTPPNAIVFGTGHIRIDQMVKAGLWLNLLGIAVIPIFVFLLGEGLLGIGAS